MSLGCFNSVFSNKFNSYVNAVIVHRIELSSQYQHESIPIFTCLFVECFSIKFSQIISFRCSFVTIIVSREEIRIQFTLIHKF